MSAYRVALCISYGPQHGYKGGYGGELVANRVVQGHGFRDGMVLLQNSQHGKE